MDDDLTISTITVRRTLAADGDVLVEYRTEPDDLPVIEIVGMLEMAKDTALHQHCCGEDQ